MFTIEYEGRYVSNTGRFTNEPEKFITYGEANDAIRAIGLGGMTVVPYVLEDTFSPEVLEVHSKIEELINKKLSCPSTAIVGLAVGRGKTTGFIKAVGKLEKERILIAVPNVGDAEAMYKEIIKNTDPDEVGIWTSCHDKDRPRDSRTFLAVDASVKMFKAEADKRRILIVTHQGERDEGKWMTTERDLVIVDEYPEPSQVTSLSRGDITNAADKEGKYSDQRRCLEQLSDFMGTEIGTHSSGAHTLSLPSFVREIAKLEYASAEGRKVRGWAEDALSGRGFFSTVGYPTLTSYRFDLPYADKTIVFSATADLEGWHLDPTGLDIYDIEGDVYPDLVIEHVNTPPEASLNADKLRGQRQAVFDAIRDKMEPALAQHDQTLVVCPKKIRERLEDALQDRIDDGSVKFLHYGVGTGSNEYRDFDSVYLVLDNHMPADALIGHRHGHGGEDKTNKTILKEMGNSRSKALQKMRKDNALRSFYQMSGRGRVRQRDGKPMKVYHMGGPELVPHFELLYPGCSVVVTEPFPVIERQTKIEFKIANYLLSETKPVLNLKDIVDSLGRRANDRAMIKDNETLWRAVGYEVSIPDDRSGVRFVRKSTPPKVRVPSSGFTVHH